MIRDSQWGSAIKHETRLSSSRRKNLGKESGGIKHIATRLPEDVY